MSDLSSPNRLILRIEIPYDSRPSESDARPSNRTDTWANVWSYTTIPSVWEILVLHTAAIRADLLRREEDGAWPDNPIALTLGDTVTLESIEFTAPIAAFYRTA